MRQIAYLFAVIAGMTLAGCETASATGPGSNDAWWGAGPAKPAAQPAIKRESFREIGRASWYGAELSGRRTASGEAFDPNALTAAHLSLPLGSMVRVTNLENGRSTVVRINDRHAATNGRVIDLSRRAAADLGIVDQGTARVALTPAR